MKTTLPQLASAVLLATALGALPGCGSGTADPAGEAAVDVTDGVVVDATAEAKATVDQPPSHGTTDPCKPPPAVSWMPPRSGQLDQAFGCRGVTVLAFDDDDVQLSALAVLPDDRIIAVGSRYDQATNNTDGWIARFDAKGRLDPGFGQGGVVTSNIESGGGEGFSAVLPLADGSLIVAGHLNPEDADPPAQALVRRLDAAGNFSPAFSSATSGPPVVLIPGMRSATGLALLADGMIGISGDHCPPSAACRAAFGRFAPVTGAPDGHFGSNGVVTTRYGAVAGGNGASVEARAHGIAATRQLTVVVGEAVTATQTSDIGLFRSSAATPAMTSASHPDFDSYESGRAIAATGHGFVVAGTAFAGGVARYFLLGLDGQGEVAPAFGPFGNGRVVVPGPGISADAAAVAIDAGGKVLVAGQMRQTANQQRILVARHDGQGTLDPDFGGAGIASFRPEGGDAAATAIGRQGSGRIIVGGWSAPDGSFRRHAVLLGLRP